MDLLTLLLKINPQFKEFLTQKIKNENGEVLGIKCFGVEKNGIVFSGGTAATQDLAFRIAVAEAFERSYLEGLFQEPKTAIEFDLKNFPSSSGFAAGFDDQSTRFRALCEALERWVWSKWIDEGYFIPECDQSSLSLSPLAKHFVKSFDDTRWFKKDFTISISPNEKLNLSILIFLGLTKEGVFPGSRVSTNQDDLTEHPIIEAHRNLGNFELQKKSPSTLSDIIQERTMYFGSHKDEALKQIQNANKHDWPLPEIALLKKADTQSNEVFLYRCLMKDFMGWHLGPVDRFVY